MTVDHAVLQPGLIHVPHQWAFADAAERLASVQTDPGDIDKLALQRDDGTYWRLRSVSPTLWAGSALSPVLSVSGKVGNVLLVKADVGLAHVNDTSDADKPVSIAQALADAAVLTTAESYADSIVTGLWKDQGNYDASGGTFPTAANTNPVVAQVSKGFIWTISVQGVLGGQAVSVGDTVRAVVDVPGQTAGNWAIGQTGTGYVPENVANKDTSNGYPGLVGFALSLLNAMGVAKSALRSLATIPRTWTLPDKDGDVAMLSDVSAALQPDALGAAMTAWFNTLPTALPDAPGVLWNNGGVLSQS